MLGFRGVLKGAALFAVAIAAAAIAARPADAQKKRVAKPEGISRVAVVTPDKGFVEDAYAFDGAGGRLALVRADAASFAEIEVIDLTQKGATLVRFDISAATTWVTQIAFVGDGQQLFVAGRTTESAMLTGYVFDLTGKLQRRFGPAKDLALVDAGGRQLLATYDEGAVKGGLQHTINFFDPADGKRVGKKLVYRADEAGYVKSLRLKIAYFRAGYTQIVGTTKGNYDKNKDQRLNDNEAVYDLVLGQFTRDVPIQDLLVHAKLLKRRLEAPHAHLYAYVADDGAALEVLPADGNEATRTEGALSLDHYDVKSLRQAVGRDGKLYFTLAIDPVNPAAVAAKKADPVHVDLYVFDPTDGKSRRLARIPENDRGYAWVVAGDHVAFLRKHKGYGRGGPELEVFKLTAK